MQLSCGSILPEFELAYNTYGSLNATRSNAVLICPALNASHEVCGVDVTRPGHVGWWDNMVGPGKPIDTDRYFVIGVANIGVCFGSTSGRSVDPMTGFPYGANFPMITVEDWVSSQAMLASQLGVQKFAAVIGGSLGGMQVLQWAVSHPDRVAHAVVIASASNLSAQNIAFNAVARQAIINDPNFRDGDYAAYDVAPKNGLSVARMLGHITYTSYRGLDEKFGRNLEGEKPGYKLCSSDFEVECYLRHQGAKFAEHFDANAYLLITKALDYFDIQKGAEASDLATAFENTTASFLIIAFTEDWRFNPDRSKEIVSALKAAGKTVSYEQIDGPYGHDGFLLDDARYHHVVRSFFAGIPQEGLTSRTRHLGLTVAR